VDELLTDKMICADDRKFLLHIQEEGRSFTEAVYYGLKLGKGWRMINVKDSEELLRGLDLPCFWILDETAVKYDKFFDGCRIYCKFFTNSISIGSKYEINIGVYIKEIYE
jgi:hypothetical protein